MAKRTMQSCLGIDKILPTRIFPQLVLSLVVLAVFSFKTYAQTSAQHSIKLRKDPKLSSLLLTLRDEIPQAASPAESKSVHHTSDEISSKPLRDALFTRQMRITSNGEVQAYIEAQEITEEHIHSLQNLGIKVQVLGDPQSHQAKDKVYAAVPTIQALVPLGVIQELEDLPFIRFVRLPDYPLSNGAAVDSQGDTILQAEYVRSAMSGIGVTGAGVTVGVISGGIAGIFATGCTNCGPAPNTSVSPSPIALGDLPSSSQGAMPLPTAGTRNSAGILTSVSGGITAVQSYRGDGDLEATAEGPDGAEGTAMLELIYDLAPGAALSFANSETGLEFEKAVDVLAYANQVVVDDQLFLEPSFDGTSSVSTNTADALNNTSNQIRAYITSAGNFALDHYQGTYASSGTDGLPYTGESGNLHLFTGLSNDLQPLPGQTTDNEGLGPSPFDPVLIVPPGQALTVHLVWNDPIGASANNYDLFLVPLTCGPIKDRLPTGPCTLSGGPALASSENLQTGTQDPVESIFFQNTGTSPVIAGVAIQNVNNSASSVTFDYFVVGYGAKETTPNHNFNVISGSIPAQSDSLGTPAPVITVGAINQVQCASPDNCTGLLEGFSSQGPLQQTPQAPMPHIKPDLVAVDEVCIDGAGGFGNVIANIDPGLSVNCGPAPPASFTPKLFGGTSAAAPHVAAIAALLLQAAPCLSYTSYNSGVGTPATARQAIYNSLTSGYAQALPGYLEPLQNNEEGWGLVDALTSVTSMLPVPMLPSSPSTANQTVSATSSNGSTVVLTGVGKDPNSCPITAIQWSGCGPSGSANAASATVTCPIGINTVRVGISNNGTSFLPIANAPYFTVTVTDFALATSPDSASASPGGIVPAGGTAVYTITIVSAAQGPFIYPVALSCSQGLPPGAQCLFSPAAVTPSTTTTASSTSTSTLTIYTPDTASSTNAEPFQFPNFPSVRLGLVWMLVVFLFAGLSLKNNYTRPLSSRLFLCGFLIFVVIEFGACGSHSTPPSSKTYTVMISGTANQLTHTTSISLTLE
jgi:Subtilase family